MTAAKGAVAATTDAAMPRRQNVAIRSGRTAGPDRLSVVLFSLAAFLIVLALLADQLRAAPRDVRGRRQVIVRRVYQTTVVETVAAPGAATSVSQSVSSSGYASRPAPTTRSS